MKLFIKLNLFLLSFFLMGSALANDHIRVILDTSISMRDHIDTKGNDVRGEDPRKLSVLSVKLLTDLLYPVIRRSKGDSYEVHTFEDEYQNWPRKGLPPASTGAKQVKLGNGSVPWDKFQKQLDGIGRNSKVTFFYPSIKGAFQSLPKRKVDEDTLTIILITDGNSDSKLLKHGGSNLKYEEEQDALNKLAKEMDRKKVRLYILGFGKANDKGFFKKMTDSEKIGRFIKVNNTEDLMTAMADIFSERFGYSLDPDPSSLPPYKVVNNSEILEKLKGEGKNKFVGILSLNQNPIAPEFTLLQSSGATSINTYNKYHVGEGITGENKKKPVGGGYFLKWLDNPSGDYQFIPKKPTSQKIIIFRPLNIDVGVGGVGSEDLNIMNNKEEELQVMAGVPEDIFYYIKTSGISGKGGIPRQAGLAVDFARRGEWKNKQYLDPRDTKFEDAIEVTPSSEKYGARWYHEEVTFPDKNEGDEADVYWNSLPVLAKLKKRTIASSVEKNAKRVIVYPRMGFTPFEGSVDLKAEGQAIQPLTEKDGDACATFILKNNKYSYYKGFKDNITIEAYLTDSSFSMGASTLGQLNRAIFTLDGEILSNPNNLYGGRLSIPYIKTASRTTLDQLIYGKIKEDDGGYKHKICVKIVAPTEGGKVNLDLNFRISSMPYSRLKVINPLHISFDVKEPDWSWWNLLWLLPLLLLLWLLKFVPNLEDDLRYTYYKLESEEQYQLYEFSISPVIKLLRRLFNLAAIYEINNISTQVPIGKILPVEDGLYGVMFDKSAKLECLSTSMGDDESPCIESRGKWLLIHVNTPYRLLLKGDDYIFRVEYE